MEIGLQSVATGIYNRLNLRDLCSPVWFVSHVIEGHVETETRGVRQTVHVGDVMIHPPDVPFSEFAAQPGLHQWMAFDAASVSGEVKTPTFGTDLLVQFPVALVVSLGNEGHQRYADHFRALEASWQSPPGEIAGSVEAAIRLLRRDAAVASLFGELLSAWAASGSPARPAVAAPLRGRFADLVAFMEAHLGERITRDQLAARAYLHPGSFDRAFRAAYGDSPLRLLQEMRLRRVRHLLSSTNETLEHIAQGCGLGDASRLGRIFRARYGVSPGTWRSESIRAKSTNLGYIPPLSGDGDANYNNVTNPVNPVNTTNTVNTVNMEGGTSL